MSEIRRAASNYIASMPLPQFNRSPVSSVRGHAAYYGDDSPKHGKSFPTLPRSGSVPRITAQTLSQILSGVYDDQFNELFIVDCRYAYEHQGGRIKGSENINSPDAMINAFFKDPIPNAVIVFHCEFSHNRGPQLAALFRETDRNMNRFSYPNLFYPNVYILDGGYREFFSAFPHLCEGGYTEMFDEFHISNGDLARETTQFRKSFERKEDPRRLENHLQKSAVLTGLLAFGLPEKPRLSAQPQTFRVTPRQLRTL
jgi:M-phase inducer tyrosine phosphatase